MNNILNNILYIVITAILPLVTAYVVALLRKKIAEVQIKIDDEVANKYITAATDSVLQAVTTVQQTYVDSLKASGKFDENAQNEAKNEAIKIATTLIKQDGIDAIEKLYGDFTVWLSTQIEMLVNNAKK